MVQAQYFVGFGHHQMQIMGDHQHRAVKLPTELVNQIVQRNLTVDVNTLRRLVQDQQLRAAEQGTGKQYAGFHRPTAFARAPQ